MLPCQRKRLLEIQGNVGQNNRKIIYIYQNKCVVFRFELLPAVTVMKLFNIRQKLSARSTKGNSKQQRNFFRFRSHRKFSPDVGRCFRGKCILLTCRHRGVKRIYFNLKSIKTANRRSRTCFQRALLRTIGMGAAFISHFTNSLLVNM